MDKYITQKELKKKINTLRKKKIVFTNGCFDLLNYNHIKYLEYSKGLGDILIVALNSDDAIKELKDKRRPIISQKHRIEMLCSLESVDYVVIFDKKIEFLTLFEMIRPDFYTKGGDYKDKTIKDIGFCEMHSKEVVIAPEYKGHSTSDLIKVILKRYGKK